MSCGRIARSGIHESGGVVAGKKLGSELEADAAGGSDDEIGGHKCDSFRKGKYRMDTARHEASMSLKHEERG